MIVNTALQLCFYVASALLTFRPSLGSTPTLVHLCASAHVNFVFVFLTRRLSNKAYEHTSVATFVFIYPQKTSEWKLMRGAEITCSLTCLVCCSHMQRNMECRRTSSKTVSSPFPSHAQTDTRLILEQELCYKDSAQSQTSPQMLVTIFGRLAVDFLAKVSFTATFLPSIEILCQKSLFPCNVRSRVVSNAALHKQSRSASATWAYSA